jgi:phage-related protein
MKVYFFSSRVEKDFSNLPLDMQAYYARIINLMEATKSWNIGMPYVRHLVNTDLYEIRLKGKTGISRAIFFTLSRNEIEILHVFIKKDEKTPKKELDLAIKRYKEAKNDK